jgi:hypothetical protein
MKKAELVKQSVPDLKFRLSKNDILELCLHEAKGGLEQAYELQRQLCMEFKVKVESAIKALETEVGTILKKRFAKMIRALADETKDEPSIEVRYDTHAHVVYFNPYPSRHRGAPRERRASVIQGFRMNKSGLKYAQLKIGNCNRSYAGCSFEASLSARDIGDVASVKRYHDAVENLNRACDKLDRLWDELEAFKRRSGAAKQELMKSILESSENGKEILELTQSLAVEVNQALPRAIPAQVITVEN